MFKHLSVIPGLRAAKNPEPRGKRRAGCPWIPDRAPRVRNDGGWKISLAAGALLLLSACAYSPPYGPGDPGPGGTAPPIPVDGPIAYTCDNGAQLMVDVEGASARVAIIGGPSMVLPRASDGYYSNGRYGFRGGGATAQWEVGRAAPVMCRGS